MALDRLKSDGVDIEVRPHQHPDRFDLSFDPAAREVTVTRVDQPTGWGQNLGLTFRDAGCPEGRTVFVGPSPSRSLRVGVDSAGRAQISFSMGHAAIADAFPLHRRVHVALGTIPSRASTPEFLGNLRALAERQTLPAERVYVTVAKAYRRFRGASVPGDAVERMLSIPKVEVLEMEDVGPACKYLGPLSMRREEIEGSLLAVVDDDRLYSRNLLRNFSIGFNLFPRARFASGDGLAYFRPEYEGMDDESVRFEVRRNNHGFSGFFGFCLRVDGMDDIVEYHREMVRRVDGAFYHDDGMIRSYAAFKGEDMLMLAHRGPNRVGHEQPDALCQTVPLDRNRVEDEMFRVSREPGFMPGGGAN